ncbi:MAG: hypothetical protein R3B60_04685 [Candidatus Paceibacterota bacterium]
MTEEKQEGQKTVVSFIVGLLIGGLLVWAFSGPSTEAPDEKMDDEKEQTEDKEDNSSNVDESKTSVDGDAMSASVTKSVTTKKDEPKLSVGDGKVVVNDQPASASIKMESATYPVSEGWIGVREYNNGQLGYILGVVRFSEEQGLVPSDIILQRSTTAGREYAVVVYEENGDRSFNLADDKQIDTIFATFKAE